MSSGDVLVWRLPRDMHHCRSLFTRPTPAIVSEIATKSSRFAHFWQRAESTAPATQKSILTSKRAPKPPVFNTFDFGTCFAPQRRALFEHLNFQKCSEHEVVLALLLPNELRATMACNFSSRISPGRFSEPTFWPSADTKPWKNTAFRDFSTFSRTCIVFLLTLSLIFFRPAEEHSTECYGIKTDLLSQFWPIAHKLNIAYYCDYCVLILSFQVRSTVNV